MSEKQTATITKEQVEHLEKFMQENMTLREDFRKLEARFSKLLDRMEGKQGGTSDAGEEITCDY